MGNIQIGGGIYEVRQDKSFLKISSYRHSRSCSYVVSSSRDGWTTWIAKTRDRHLDRERRSEDLAGHVE